MAKKKNPVRWGYAFYEEDGAAPAYDWLRALPDNIREEFLNTLESVLLSSNPPTQYLLNRWHAMKKVGDIDMGGYHEARDQHEDTNYRLYCRFDRAAADVEALGSPVLVILHGASKPLGHRCRNRSTERYNDSGIATSKPSDVARRSSSPQLS